MTPNQLPPLPAADHRGPNGTGAYFDSFTAAQMHTYALAALAQQAQECTRSHPHELMSPMCGLRTEIARLTNENERFKRAQQAQPVQADAQRSCPDACITPEKCCNFGCQKVTPPAPQVPAPVDERSDFEASMREKHGWVARDFQSDSFGYFDGHTATAWLAWQARAALQTKGQP